MTPSSAVPPSGSTRAPNGHLPVAPLPRAARPAHLLRTGGAVVLLASTWVGAMWHHPMPGLVAAGLGIVVVVAVVAHRPGLLIVAAGLLASALGARAMAGLDPVEARPFRGAVTLVSDPTRTPYGVRVDVRADGHRLELDAAGPAAGSVSGALAGERLMVVGRQRPPPPDAPWLVPRRIVGRLTATDVAPLDTGTGPSRAANRVRRLLGRGAAGLDPTTRALYLGFVLGDDREQAVEIVDDFRGSGLSHVLVVSGQNLAFILVLVQPMVSRQAWWLRWAVTIAVIGAFVLVTRAEPSVLRAAAMATLAVSAAALGRPLAPLRRLCLAVTVLVVIDPLLVASVGFQLSVGASAGIAVLAGPIGRRLPGPRWWSEALGVTLAAQVGVAPVAIPRFGGLPIISVVTNLVAVPVAGLVTTWGLPAGLFAGLLGAPFASLLHLPTRVGIGWVAGVARVGARLPVGLLDGRGATALTAGLGLVWVAGALRRGGGGGEGPVRDGVGSSPAAGGQPPAAPIRLARRLGWMVVALAVIAPGLALRSPPGRAAPGPGITVLHARGVTVVVLDGRSSPAAVLEALRRGGVTTIDLLVLPGDLRGDLARALRHRWGAVRSADRRRPGGLRVLLGPVTCVVDATTGAASLEPIGG